MEKLEAIEKSICHWMENLSHLKAGNTDIDIYMESCPLCKYSAIRKGYMNEDEKIYFVREMCKTCPLGQYTGKYCGDHGEQYWRPISVLYNEYMEYNDNESDKKEKELIFKAMIYRVYKMIFILYKIYFSEKLYKTKEELYSKYKNMKFIKESIDHWENNLELLYLNYTYDRKIQRGRIVKPVTEDNIRLGTEFLNSVYHDNVYSYYKNISDLIITDKKKYITIEMIISICEMVMALYKHLWRL